MSIIIRTEQSMASLHLKADQVFAKSGPVIFQDRFNQRLQQWMLSIDDAKQADTRNPRVVLLLHDVEAAPAVRMTLPGDPGLFRSELSLPAEKNYQERWYAERTLIPQATDDNGFILMQWHALIGEEKKLHQNETGIRNFPNLAIHVQGNKYSVSRAWGPLVNSYRDHQTMRQPWLATEWTDWVIHAVWSEQDNGLLQVWQNRQLVYEARGPNLYNDVERVTPYFKTGIYRPSRKPKNGDNRGEADTVIYVRDVTIGNASADLSLMQNSFSH
jgi:hypothetical protein